MTKKCIEMGRRISKEIREEIIRKVQMGEYAPGLAEQNGVSTRIIYS